MVDVEVPVSLEGRQTIAALRAHAAHVTPVVNTSLPGSSQHEARRVPASLRQADRSQECLLRAEYAQALADLASAKGAPASVHTDLAWRAYRMRNIIAPSRTERLALDIYRWVGYGERVLPALTCWAVFSLVTVIIVH